MTLSYETITLFFVAVSALAAGAHYIGQKLQKISDKLQLYVKQSDCKQRRQSCTCYGNMAKSLQTIVTQLGKK